MSKQVDERVVSMQFDNKHFEKNVQQSMSTLDKLKQKLNFKDSGKGLEEVGKAASKVNFSGMSRGIEVVHAQFSALQVMGVTALANITNSAVNAGKNIVKALTIDPVKTGFQEYETQMGAIQTILANTESKGSTLQDVNNALNELNKYADQTIYNFTEMTRNIGTFTAAGVDLEKSVTSIKGIANLAAVSGSTSQQASTAMYQLSQALAAGKVSLMDWNSVVNAGMGGEVFQTALKRTATQMGHNVDAIIEKYGSFRESLTQGEWLTAEVLTETLTQLSGAYTEADLIAQGYTESQAKEIVKLAKTAVGAATEVKTFTQLMDTLKESVQSGWTQSWQTIIGDFGEAKELFTGISDALGGMINKSAEARNKLLTEGLSSGWKQLLAQGIQDEQTFKDTIKQVAKDYGTDVDAVIKEMGEGGTFEKSLKQGWLTTDILAESISKLTDKTRGLSDVEIKNLGYTRDQINALEELDKNVKSGAISLDEFAKKMSMESGRRNLITGFKNISKGLSSVLTPIGDAFREVFPMMSGDKLYKLTEGFVNFTEKLKLSSDNAGRLKDTFKGLFSLLDIGKQIITSVTKPLIEFATGGATSNILTGILTVTSTIGNFFTEINNSLKAGDGFSVISDTLTHFLDIVSQGISGLMTNAPKLGDAFSWMFDGALTVLEKVGSVIEKVFGWMRENISAGDIFAGLAGGGIFLLVKKIGDFVDNIKEAFDIFGGGDGSIKESVTDVLESVKDSLVSFQTGIKVASIVAIAGAVALLSSSIKKISDIKPAKVAYSLFAIGVMITALSLGFRSLSKSLSTFNPKRMISSGIALMAMAKAIDILADAMTELSELSWNGIAKGLVGVGVAMFALSTSLDKIAGNKIFLRTSIAVLAIAKACDILSEAVIKFSGLSWIEIARGLTAMGVALFELSASLGVMNRISGGKGMASALALLIAVQALAEMAEGLKSFATMSWGEIGRGLVAMGGALLELGSVIAIVGRIAGLKGIFGATALLIGAQALEPLADALKKFSTMSWGEIGRGLVAMGGALLELGGVITAVGYITGLKGIFGATALLIGVQALDPLADALKKFADMAWDEIGRGLAAMGGALLELGGVVTAIGYVSGFGSILGATSLVIGVQSLEPLAESLKKFSEMSWSEIGRGLTAMGGALLELGGISGALGYLTGFAGLVGAGTLVLAVQCLDDLSSAMIKFGSMSWSEIGRGLAAMGGALLELGTISGATGYLTNFAGLVGAGTIALASQGLGDLADAFIKFGSMSWSEIGHGLTAMSSAMGVTALGGLLNTLSGFGAKAISEMAKPLGDLADSVKKWQDVSVPDNLGSQVGSLARGVYPFTFGLLGAGTLSMVAPSIGEMADSIRKWSGVTIPGGLEEGLKSIANGVKAFTWAFVGGFSIGVITKPLADLSGSVTKWNGVSIPDNLESGLTGLANGVKAFTWAFMGGFSIGVITKPLADLATSVSKWNGVSIPDNLESGLTGLANGVEAFSFSFLGGWSLESVVGPIGDLASSVKKWNGVSISDNIGDSLKSLADGVSSFAGIREGTISKISKVSESLKTYSDNLSSVSFSIIYSSISVVKKLAGLITELSTLNASGIDSFRSVTKIGDSLSEYTKRVSGLDYTSISSSIQTVNQLKNLILGLQVLETMGVTGFVNAMTTLATTSVNAFISSFSMPITGLTAVGSTMIGNVISGANSKLGALKTTATNLSLAVSTTMSGTKNNFFKTAQTLIDGFISGANGKKSSLENMAKTLVKNVTSVMTKEQNQFKKAAETLLNGFANGIKENTESVKSAAKGVANDAANSIKSKEIRSKFETAGKYVVDGFVSGIKANKYRAINAAIKMVREAIEAAEEEADINSPSKEFYRIGDFSGMGFVNALDDYGQKSYKAGAGMAKSARSGLSDAIGRISDLVNGDFDVQPTIRPVLDLSDVQSGAGTISDMLRLGQSVGVSTNVGAISRMMKQRSQNGSNDDVVSAINKLKDGLSNLGGTQYNINGITYDDGSNISEAVGALVRAARIERRV